MGGSRRAKGFEGEAGRPEGGPACSRAGRFPDRYLVLQLMLIRKKPKGPGSGVLMKAAMDYGRLGWSVVPVEPKGKAPMIRWQVYQHRPPETSEIGDWFTRWPDANLAVVTGVVSDLIVLDLNPRQGADASRARLEKMHGPLPETVEALTGGGGRHVYFRHPGGILHGRVALAPGIEMHGDGGCVVAPPSRHVCGEDYRWTRSPDVFHLEPLPVWLSSLAVTGERSVGATGHWRHLSPTSVAEGERRQAIASLTGYLLAKGVDPEVALELMLCWNAIHCRPPLPLDAVIQAVADIEHRREGG